MLATFFLGGGGGADKKKVNFINVSRFLNSIALYRCFFREKIAPLPSLCTYIVRQCQYSGGKLHVSDLCKMFFEEKMIFLLSSQNHVGILLQIGVE